MFGVNLRQSLVFSSKFSISLSSSFIFVQFTSPFSLFHQYFLIHLLHAWLCVSPPCRLLQGIIVFGTQLDHPAENPSSLQDQIVSLSFDVSCLHLGVDRLPHQHLLLRQLSTLLQKCQTLSIIVICRL